MAFDLGTEKQLFIAQRWFASQRGIRLTVNPPVKAERVLVPEEPWEANGIHSYNTVL